MGECRAAGKPSRAVNAVLFELRGFNSLLSHHLRRSRPALVARCSLGKRVAPERGSESSILFFSAICLHSQAGKASDS